MQSIIIMSSWLHNLAEDSSRKANWKAGIVRPSPNHETLWLPNDDDDGCMNPRNVPDCFVQQLHAFNLSQNIPMLLNLIKK